MRAQLIELTPDSRTRSRKAWWLNRPFTSAWQSSKVPSIAIAWTLSSVAVVIIRRCTSEMRPCGNSTNRSVALAAAERLDRGAAGVARGRHHDGGALAARRQRVVHQPRQELHGHVLEGERRTVEQLEQEGAGAELRDRHHRGMPEGAVGLARQPRQVGLRDGVADERPDHLDRHLGVGPAGQAGDGLAATSRGQVSGT